MIPTFQLASGHRRTGGPSANQVSHLRFNGADGSTTFTDETGLVWGAIAGAVLTTTTPLYGSASGLFSGTSRIASAISATTLLGAGDFKIEASVMFTSLSSAGQAICARWGSSDLSYIWDVLNTAGAYTLRFDYSTDGSAVAGSLSVAWTPVINTKYDLAVSRSGSDLRFFVNGVQQGATQTVTGTFFPSSLSGLRIGAMQNAPTYYFQGRIDEFRMTRNEAITAGYTPVLPFP